MAEEYAGAGITEVKGFEAEFDEWEYSGDVRGVMRGVGCCSIVFGLRY